MTPRKKKDKPVEQPEQQTISEPVQAEAQPEPKLEAPPPEPKPEPEAKVEPKPEEKPEPQRYSLEYVGAYGRRKRPASVAGIGYIYYLQEVTVDLSVGDVSTDPESGEITIDKATSERLRSTGEWQLATDRCKHVKLNNERCENTRKEGERFCELHLRIYSPGDKPTEAANDRKQHS